jgi:hypothetical protein
MADDIIELVARLLCRQRGIDPDREVISGPIAAPAGRDPTWHFWRKDAAELVALIDGRWGGEGTQQAARRAMGQQAERGNG